MSVPTKNFMVVISALGEGPIYFTVFICIFNRGSRARAFYYLMGLCSCLFLMNITKMAYHDPRPFMTDDRIAEYGCSNEYGNPSGHVLFSAAFFAFMFLDVFHGERTFNEANKLRYFASLLGSVTIVYTIAIARLYTGNHALN